MGRRYSFELFYPRAQVRDGLLALDQYRPPGRRRRSSRREGQRVALADSISFARLSPDTPLFLQQSLLFPADDHIRRFHGEDAEDLVEWDDEGHEYLPVGSIDVTIRVGEVFSLFTYAACTSSISDLFQKSRPIWSQFDSIRESSGGLLGLFNDCRVRGEWNYPLLPNGREGVPLNFFDFVLEERDTYWHLDVDRFTRTALSTPRAPSSSDK